MDHKIVIRKDHGRWCVSCTCTEHDEGSTWDVVAQWAQLHYKFSPDKMEAIDPEPLVRTRLAWDLLEHHEMRETWLPLLGLTPASAEMEDLEHVESHARLEKLVPLVHLTSVYLNLISEIIAVFYGHEAGGEKDEAFEATVAIVLKQGVFALLAEYLADGVLSYGPLLAEVAL